MIKGWKKLTKKELQHLKDEQCNNTVVFQKTINHQHKFRQMGTTEPCYECKFIAKKLGMTPEEE